MTCKLFLCRDLWVRDKKKLVGPTILIRRHGYSICKYVMQGSRGFWHLSVGILSPPSDGCYIWVNHRFNWMMSDGQLRRQTIVGWRAMSEVCSSRQMRKVYFLTRQKCPYQLGAYVQLVYWNQRGQELGINGPSFFYYCRCKFTLFLV